MYFAQLLLETKASVYIAEFARNVCNKYNTNESDVFVLVLADMNTPYGKSRMRVADFARPALSEDFGCKPGAHEIC